jgi:DGQHR domain-containing protein
VKNHEFTEVAKRHTMSPHDPHGPALNRRVATLFERAGFKTMPSSASTAEFEVTIHGNKVKPLDLLATDEKLGITIIGSNKSGSIPGSFSGHLSDLKELKTAAKAKKVILVATRPGEITQEDRDAAADAGVVVWTESDLRYYEALTDAIHQFAKFEIIHALGLKTKEEKQTTYVLAIRISQPTPSSPIELFMFSLSPEKLLKTCAVYRKAHGRAEAYQRMVNKKRLPGIRSFVSKPDSILPTNIVVDLDPTRVSIVELEKAADEANLTSKTLTLTTSNHQLVALGIPMEYASMELLDGQHRLFGFVDAAPATRETFGLAVVGVKGLNPKQKQATFVSINDTSRRMDPNLVSFLQYEKDDSLCQRDNKLMAIRVAVDLSDRQPFLKKIRLLDMAGTQKMTLKGVSGYDLKGIVGPKGALRKVFPTNTPKDYVSYLSTYYSLVRSTFKTEWDDSQTYILATNRGFTALLKLLKSILRTEPDTNDPQITKKYIKALSGFNWDYNKLKQKYVGSQGWKGFHADLVKQVRKTFPDFEA